MSQYYRAQRTQGIYDPRGDKPFKLSRSKIDLFLECPRCFYLDRRLGVGRPPGFPFNLNSAVDALLKKEFDLHRAQGEAHPLMKQYGIAAVPLAHPMLDEWRENFKGVQFHHKPTNFIVTGAVDDVWVDEAGRLIVVDYKATSKDEEVNLDAAWQIGYKRQMETYQWLLRQNGFQVNDVGYFVYCNGRKDRAAFDGKLEFDVKVIPYNGDATWVEGTLVAAQKCLTSAKLPMAGGECDYCAYRDTAEKATKN
ncbi:MAG: PD-(D/E)XK nuclease family protein [Candidatus Niyogibacteria bacterium]|nr:PD-(D/E)XK nuclease family protein [Candidatus Niyogibacteria bacterium]